VRRLPSRIGTAGAFALIAATRPAEAHLNATGMGPIYDGLLHFLSSPEDLVPTFALALLAGLRGAAYGRRLLLTLPAAWIAGSLIGLSVATASSSSALSAAWLLLTGGLVVTDTRLSLTVMTIVAVLFGLVHGYLNGAGTGASASAMVSIIGVAGAVFVLVCLAAALLVQLRQFWARIVIRVAGSWIAATGMLMLGWSLRVG
jgi:urease accessory protein